MSSILSIIIYITTFLTDIKIKNRIDKEARPHKELCNGHVIITKLHNKGIMLGKLSDKPVLVKVLVSAAMILAHIFYIPFLFKKGSTPHKIGWGMLLGGAWSNVYDHFKKGYVVDYIQVPHGFIKRIVFNLGDFFIALGAIIVSLFSIF